jgi:hypothetical protein
MWLRFALLVLALVVLATPAGAQFRRGILSESTEIMLYPLEVPAMLMPAGKVMVDVRNSSTAPARIVERLNESFRRQLAENDARLEVAASGADINVVVTVLEWRESRRNSTKYVSELRQVGTKQVKDKDGKIKNEPVYEYGRNRPSVVINANAGLRVEVRPGRGTALADETVTQAVQEEHLLDAGPPSREAIEDQLLDQVVRKAAARISPGRSTQRVLLARSNEVDKLNSMALNRRWHEWLTALEAVKPHSDRKRDAYRLHNLAVAHEAVAYEATDTEDWIARLNLASRFVEQARAQNSDEKYIQESATRIAQSAGRYQQLVTLFRDAGVATRGASAPAAAPVAPPATALAVASAPAPAPAGPMTNKDVIELRLGGLDDDNLIAAIKASDSVRFDLSAAGLRELLAAKVSNRVITAMRSRPK